MSGIRVEIVDQPLRGEDYLSNMAAREHGGECSFVGRVRCQNLGRNVKGVAYDVHETLAKRSLEKLAAEAQQRFDPNAHVTIVHRQGYLEVGEPSVLVAVTSRHRHEAFVLCRYVIDELKHRTPIWKKEYYEDGESGWVQGYALSQQAQIDSHQ